ncbi:MAG: hypothetical protein GY700_16905, partial [Propionibacteriaceae bacterium]|nr:hypothetical protein [Propionibacteriaceae bacterium]
LIVPGFHMGQGVDHEPDGQPNLQALGDDLNLIYPGIPYLPGDEDGVTFLTPLIIGQVAKVQVTASAPGVLNAWIDFDGDKIWTMGPPEQISIDMPLVAGVNVFAFTVSGGTVEPTYARFRFSTQQGLTPDGPAPDGEVEDYVVELQEPGNPSWTKLVNGEPWVGDIPITVETSKTVTIV